MVEDKLDGCKTGPVHPNEDQMVNGGDINSADFLRLPTGNKMSNGHQLADLSPLSTDSGIQMNPDSTPSSSNDSSPGGLTPPCDHLMAPPTLTNGHSQTEEETPEDGEKKAERIACSVVDAEDILLIQDTSFTVKIVPPNVDPFDLQVSSVELVQEIHQVLMDREETCHRTCFSLQLNGQPLDNFAELKSIEGMRDGALLKVVEEPYTVREGRIHLRHVRDLLKSLDPTDAYNGNDCASLSFLGAITNGNLSERKRLKPENIDCTPPDYIMPGCKDRPLMPVLVNSKENSNLQCLKVLSVSGWNPPPGHRKMHGDLMYLYVLTLEDKRYHVTCCTKGFFVNMSTEDEFNPKPANQKFVHHSLVELLSHLSPLFKKNFAIVQKKRCQRHPFERMPTPYQVHTWLAPQVEHQVDFIRAEDAFSFKLGYEEHIPGQTREWNEELQTTRELPRKSLPERLLRERAIFKVHSDFISAATRGAVAVIDGNVMAINPGEETKMQMFIWNNIFFSLGFDVKDHYKEFGGDAAAHVAPVNDLQGVKAYFNLDAEGLYLLGTAVIDYRGYRITAQSIIPGILERDQEQSVVYGSIDFGKTVVTSEKYLQLLEKPAQQLKILPHEVVSEKGEIVKLESSVESKGIIGNDGRHYILDLLRTFPPDVNFLPDVEVNDVCKQNGFPRQHPHRLACLRQELIDAFVDARYITFIKIAAYHLQKLRLQKIGQTNGVDDETTTAEAKIIEIPTVPAAEEQSDTNNNSNAANGVTDKSEELLFCNGLLNDIKTSADRDGSNLLSGGETVESPEIDEIRKKFAAVDETAVKTGGDFPPAEEAKRIMESISEAKVDIMEDSTKQIIRKATEAVGSLSDTEFDIRFNPDCYCDAVKHAGSESLEKQRRLVKDAAQFLLASQIPNFIRDCLEHNFIPLDGSSITEALHTRGINMRYLGKITELINGLPMLNYVKIICLCELICRSAKHVLRPYLQAADQAHLSAAICHFLNCLLGCSTQPLATQFEDVGPRRKLSKKKKISRSSSMDSTEWTQLTPKSLWTKIQADMTTYYGYTLECENIDLLQEEFSVQKLSLLRRFCMICGIQIQLRDYSFDSKSKATFSEEDIVNVYPITKHINPKATDAFSFYKTGQAKIQEGQLRAGYELINEAHNLLNNVYGALHPEIAQCLRLIARLSYILGDHQEALQQQQKAVLISERCSGIDHPNTILEYTFLALYSFANWQVSTSLKLLYRARHLLLIAHGENHPHMSLLDSNIGLILHAVAEYDLSLKFLEHALQLNILYYGAQSLKVALSYHLIARTQSCRGDFRTALQYEKETFTIYKNALGEEHEKTKESGDCLKHLTQQAVTLQKRMNEITRNAGSVSQLLPLQIQQPSITSVLEVLNIINGIVFIQISAKEVEAIRAELEKSAEADYATTSVKICEEESVEVASR